MEANNIAMEMLNNLPGMVFLCQNDPPLYTFSFASEGSKHVCGYTPKELENKVRFFDLVHPEDIRVLRKLFKATLSMGVPLETTFRIKSKDGVEKLLMMRSRIVETDSDGMPKIIEGFCIDITRQLRIETSKQSNRAITGFLTKISQEIRNPMNAIIGMAEMGLREDLPENVREYTHNIKKAGSSLMLALGDVMDYAKLGSGEMEIYPVGYSLTSLINEITSIAKAQASASGLNFMVEVASDIPDELVGDAVRLRQVILYAISNAVKFTDEGYVSFSVSGEDSDGLVYLNIVIEDTGRGIKPEDIDNIFEEFSQFDAKNIEGTGLGLVIAQNLVKLMGGDITVSSVFGVGSVFTITLPQKTGSPESQGVPPERTYTSFVPEYDDDTEFVKFQAPTARVLVVDDIHSNLVVAEGLLEFFGITIDLCESGVEALEAVKSCEYDLIFMDHLMPVMDGIATTQCIRNMEEPSKTDCKNVPIVALTANAAFTSRDMFNRSGFDDLLLKPIEIPLLTAILEKWIPKEKLISAV